MDDMGKKLTTSCFQELLVTGLVSKITEKEYFKSKVATATARYAYSKANKPP